uniref:Uncharacterized protein n=1 Tax=Plectus sambesii TaxID=2011161 RepID=A0A914XG75_9BILA
MLDGAYLGDDSPMTDSPNGNCLIASRSTRRRCDNALTRFDSIEPRRGSVRINSRLSPRTVYRVQEHIRHPPPPPPLPRVPQWLDNESSCETPQVAVGAQAVRAECARVFVRCPAKLPPSSSIKLLFAPLITLSFSPIGPSAALLAAEYGSASLVAQQDGFDVVGAVRRFIEPCVRRLRILSMATVICRVEGTMDRPSAGKTNRSLTRRSTGHRRGHAPHICNLYAACGRCWTRRWSRFGPAGRFDARLTHSCVRSSRRARPLRQSALDIDSRPAPFSSSPRPLINKGGRVRSTDS